jgi:hypothetical protein
VPLGYLDYKSGMFPKVLGVLLIVASSPKVEGVTGEYFANGKPRTSNRAPCCDDATARLWP